jgi:hypothetical protein
VDEEVLGGVVLTRDRPKKATGSLLYIGAASSLTEPWAPKDGARRALVFVDPKVVINVDPVTLVIDVAKREGVLFARVALVDGDGYVHGTATHALDGTRSAERFGGFLPGHRVVGLPTVADDPRGRPSLDLSAEVHAPSETERRRG